MKFASKSRTLATGALSCFVLALIALALLHIFRSDYKVADQMVSDYAVGRFGGLMVIVFLAWSTGITLLGIALLMQGQSSIARRVGVLLFGVTAIGLVVSAVYPTDLAGAPDTREGDIHAYSFLVNIVSLLIAIPLLSFGFRENHDWKKFRPAALLLSIFVVLTFLLQFFTLRKGMPYGLTNRLFVIVLFSWFISTAARLRTLPTSAVEA